MLLTSVAFAVGVVRLAKKRCLVQELPAIEVLARVDVLCVDKTGTITAGTLALADVCPLDGKDRATIDCGTCCPRPIGSRSERQRRRALRTAYPDKTAWQATGRVPFSSARKWSAMTFDNEGSRVLGAPENVLTSNYEGDIRSDVERHAQEGQRVLLLASADGTFSDGAEGTVAQGHADRTRAVGRHRSTKTLPRL